MCNLTSTSSRWAARLSVWPRNEANGGQYTFLRAPLFIWGNSFSVSLLLFQSWVVFTVACMSWAELTVSVRYWYVWLPGVCSSPPRRSNSPKKFTLFSSSSSSPGAYVTGQTWETAAGKSTSPRRQHLKRPRGLLSACQRQGDSVTLCYTLTWLRLEKRVSDRLIHFLPSVVLKYTQPA